MQDPLPFSKIEEAEPRFLLQSSIWDALYSDTDGTKFQMDDNGKLIVPVADIEASKVKLFGPNVTLTYESIGEGETTFEYYSDENTYHIPVYGIDAYTPYVVDGEKKGNTMILTVGYVPAGEYWTQDKDGNKIPPQPSRYMEYTMTKVDEENYILSAIASLEDSASSSEK